jgi:hypothetical protein
MQAVQVGKLLRYLQAPPALALNGVPGPVLSREGLGRKIVVNVGVAITLRIAVRGGRLRRERWRRRGNKGVGILPLGQHFGVAQDLLGRNCQSALLNHVFRNRCRVYRLLQLFAVHLFPILALAPRHQRPPASPPHAPLHNVRHQVEPLAIPGQNACPHLVLGIRLDFAFERAADAAEREVVALLVLLHRAPYDSREQVAPCGIEVGEVCSVGLVAIVVAFVERGARGCYEGLEERVRGDARGLEVDLIDEGTKDAQLVRWLALLCWIRS